MVQENLGCVNLFHFRSPDFDWASNMGQALCQALGFRGVCLFRPYKHVCWNLPLRLRFCLFLLSVLSVHLFYILMQCYQLHTYLKLGQTLYHHEMFLFCLDLFFFLVSFEQKAMRYVFLPSFYFLLFCIFLLKVYLSSGTQLGLAFCSNNLCL